MGPSGCKLKSKARDHATYSYLRDYTNDGLPCQNMYMNAVWVCTRTLHPLFLDPFSFQIMLWPSFATENPPLSILLVYEY